jgi:dTDP-4-amino-4,6-dideoxygalactose transaminase
VGARPVYVDIDERTFNLDPLKLGRAISPRTKAVLPVHLYGQPCALGPLLAICDRAGLPLVEDAAQAHGAVYDGKTVGTIGRMGAFSFYPGKNLGAYGEGGALTLNDDGLAARARALRDHGSTRRYYHDELGYNYRMEGIQGAILRVKLKRLAAWNAARRRVARRYQELLADTPLRLPEEAAGGQSAWHLFVVRHPRRDALKAYLEAAHIGCALHYPLPLHLQKCFADLGYREGDFPVAERAAKECLALPIYPELTDVQIERVAATIKAFFQR